MGHRLYDPLTGRVLSADPIVQEPFNLQNLNRYSYVLNNPLSYTDPTGLSFVRKYWRQIVATAIGVAMPHLFAWAKGLASVKALTPALKFAAGVTGGFVGGVVGSGSLQGGLKGAFTGGLFAGIGNYAAAVGASGSIGHLLAHAVAGGVSGMLQGGKFGHGFISAGVGKAASPWVDSLGGDGFGATLAEATVTGLIAGTVSVATGGKFGHGASTAAFAYALNQALSSKKVVTDLNQIRQLSPAELHALHDALDASRKEFESLSTKALFVRFPEAKGLIGAFGEDGAADFARRALAHHLIPLQLETVRVTMTGATVGAVDDVIGTVVVGPAASRVHKMLGEAYDHVDTMHFAGETGSRFGLFGSRPPVTISCLYYEGCTASIGR